MILAAFDSVGIMLLFLQLTPPGLPLSVDAAAERFRSATLSQEFFFYPMLVAVGIAFGGGVCGAVFARRFLLWLYVAKSAAFMALRCHLLFEMSRYGQTISSTPLLVDMLLATACILVDISGSDAAAKLAIDLAFNEVAERHKQFLQSRSTTGGGSRAASNDSGWSSLRSRLSGSVGSSQGRRRSPNNVARFRTWGSRGPSAFAAVSRASSATTPTPRAEVQMGVPVAAGVTNFAGADGVSTHVHDRL